MDDLSINEAAQPRHWSNLSPPDQTLMVRLANKGSSLTDPDFDRLADLGLAEQGIAALFRPPQVKYSCAVWMAFLQ